MNFDVLIRIDPVEAISDELACGVMQLRCELGASRARTYDGDVELLRPQRLWLRVTADICVHEAAVEARGLEWRVQAYRVFAHPGGAEIIALTPYGNH